MDIRVVETLWEETKYDLEISHANMEILFKESIPAAIKGYFSGKEGVEFLNIKTQNLSENGKQSGAQLKLNLSIDPTQHSPAKIKRDMDKVMRKTTDPALKTHKELHKKLVKLEDRLYSSIITYKPFHQSDEFPQITLFLFCPTKSYKVDVNLADGTRQNLREYDPHNLNPKLSRFKTKTSQFKPQHIKNSVVYKYIQYVLSHKNVYCAESALTVISAEQVCAYVCGKLQNNYDAKHPEEANNRKREEFLDELMVRGINPFQQKEFS